MVGFEKATELTSVWWLHLFWLWSVPLSRPKICCALLCVLPRNYKEERFSSRLKMYYGRKCSVLACTGNAEIVHSFLKEPNTQRAVMFVYEKITVQFNPQLHISLNHFTEDSFENLG